MIKYLFTDKDLEKVKNVSSPEVAYSLGIIWSDGCVRYKPDQNRYVTSISIAESDGKEILPILQTWGPWKAYKVKKPLDKPNWKTTNHLNLNSKVLAEYLASLGFGSKSLISACKTLNTIPDDLKPYFFRGIIDGDGHIQSANSSCKLVVAGSYNQDWKYFIDLCDKLGVKFSIKKTIRHNKKSGKENKGSCFFIFGRENTKRVLDYCYKGSNLDKIGLSRKIERYVEVLSPEYWSTLNQEQRDVSRFMTKAGQTTPVYPTKLSEKDCALRYNLMAEELEEFKIALGWDGEKFCPDKFDVIECADALIDSLYVTYGALSAIGINARPIWKAIHDNNMTKFDGGWVDEHGKLRKGPNYKPVDLSVFFPGVPQN